MAFECVNQGNHQNHIIWNYMINKKEKIFLEKLLVTPSPTGFESAGQKAWLEYVSNFADETETDHYGSAVAKVVKDPEAITIMLEAHCDEIGMMIKFIDENGFIYITKIGGSDPSITRAKRVFIHTSRGIVSGIVGNTAIHLQDKEKNKLPVWSELFLDIGVSSKEEALQLVQVGDPITFADDFEFLNDDILTGRALDNRIGGFIIAQALKKLKKHKADLNVNVLALNSVQEEIGGYGARMMSFRLMPDAAMVTDVTHATDTPGISQKEHGQTLLGAGPAVMHGSSNHPVLVRKIVEAAEKNNISIQHEATSYRTGTDTDSIFYTQSGIPSALVSLPLRYMHSPVETVSMRDIENVIELMVQTVLSLKKDDVFKNIL